MRGRRLDDDFEAFVGARTPDLHHDAFVLMAGQDAAERLVAHTLAGLRRDRVDFTQAAATARLRMARTAARIDAASDADLPATLRPLARLTPRQRAILLLETYDGYDLHSVAKALQLPAKQVGETYAAIPEDLASSHELRSLISEFGDLANTPDVPTTLTQVREIPPPRQRPRWSYAAAALVVAVTIAGSLSAQAWHRDWLRTPDGLNHAHGTHFPAYTEGYKLVGIRDQAPGPAETLDLGAQDAIVIECNAGQADRTSVARMSSQLIGDFEAACSSVGGRQHMTPAMGQTVVAIDDFGRKQWPVATYRKLSWAQYPVAQKDFTVEQDRTLATVRPTDEAGHPIRPTTPGNVVTLHGTAGRPNGTFRATLPVPPTRTNTLPVFSGLLSPTTTGQFQLRIGHQSPQTTCGMPDQLLYGGLLNSRTCSLGDRQIPQVTYANWGAIKSNSPTMTVEFTVKHALGPWTLQLVWDSYRTDSQGAVIPP
jgi:hypothetical protein